MSRRIASNSRPSASTSVSLRWANVATSEIAMCASFDLEYAVTGGCGDAGLDFGVLLVLRAIAEVLHHALFQRDDAGVADAHPAAEWHLDAGGLSRFEQCGGAVDVRCFRSEERRVGKERRSRW